MKVHVSREAPETTTDIYLRGEDDELIAIFLKGHEETAERIATLLNAPEAEELIPLLRAEHMTRLDQELIHCDIARAAGVREHLLAVKDNRYEVWKACGVCAALVGKVR